MCKYLRIQQFLFCRSSREALKKAVFHLHICILSYLHIKLVARQRWVVVTRFGAHPLHWRLGTDQHKLCKLKNGNLINQATVR